MTTLAFVLAAAAALAPGRDHTVVGGAIARVVDAEPPLFKGDADKRRTAGLMVAIAFRESSLRADAKGDKDKNGVTHSWCTYQIHDTNGGSQRLIDEPDACAREGFRNLKQSIKIDRRYPVAFYARGGRYVAAGCHTAAADAAELPPICAEARRLSNDRVALGAWLVRQVPAEVVSPGPTGFFAPAGAASCCATASQWLGCAAFSFSGRCFAARRWEAAA